MVRPWYIISVHTVPQSGAIADMSFDVGGFIQSEGLQNVIALIKAELTELGNCFKLYVDARQSVIKELAVCVLVAAEYLAENVLLPQHENAEGEF